MWPMPTLYYTCFFNKDTQMGPLWLVWGPFANHKPHLGLTRAKNKILAISCTHTQRTFVSCSPPVLLVSTSWPKRTLWPKLWPTDAPLAPFWASSGLVVVGRGGEGGGSKVTKTQSLFCLRFKKISKGSRGVTLTENGLILGLEAPRIRLMRAEIQAFSGQNGQKLLLDRPEWRFQSPFNDIIWGYGCC